MEIVCFDSFNNDVHYYSSDDKLDFSYNDWLTLVHDGRLVIDYSIDGCFCFRCYSFRYV